ncbi:MAG: protein-L-isoaspartate O-methyltransferase [Bacteroidia bacterium]|nr:MAG: protein-L-isoaspartate O-methyltransferase [Bacteroidia bacterium]
MEKEFKFKGLRQKLVKELRKKGISDEEVLAAIEKVKRHLFVDELIQESAYEDRALPILLNQTISQPYTVAFQTQILEVKKGLRVLEIGLGSGYQAAVLCEMEAIVFSVERLKELALLTKERLKKLGYDVQIKIGDGTLGWQTFAPFDRILVTAASPQVPDTLLKQLNIGGILVIPVGNKEIQKMYKIIKIDENHYETKVYDDFKFVPLIGDKGWKE